MRAEMLDSVLQELNAVSPAVEASAIISFDGLVMASSIPSEMEEERLAAMAAAMLSLGDRATSELNRGEMQQMLIRGNSGFIILTLATDDAVLVVLTQSAAKIGLTMLDIKRSIKDVKDLL